jgi:hypothetical protein
VHRPERAPISRPSHLHLGRHQEILDLKPDLMLAFSYLQADIGVVLIQHGIAVHGDLRHDPLGAIGGGPETGLANKIGADLAAV